MFKFLSLFKKTFRLHPNYVVNDRIYIENRKYLKFLKIILFLNNLSGQNKNIFTAKIENI